MMWRPFRCSRPRVGEPTQQAFQPGPGKTAIGGLIPAQHDHQFGGRERPEFGRAQAKAVQPRPHQPGPVEAARCAHAAAPG